MIAYRSNPPQPRVVGPTAAPATFPYPHRTCAEVARDEAGVFHDAGDAK